MNTSQSPPAKAPSSPISTRVSSIRNFSHHHPTNTPPSVRTQTTDTPTYLTSGFYRIAPGPVRDIPPYTYEETKYVLSGQIDVLDEATGVTHHLVAGDFAFFHVGSKAQFSSKSGGMAFFAVTRAVINEHPGLKGREEVVTSRSKL
jgi:uncharacterized cupin superfamily protein